MAVNLGDLLLMSTSLQLLAARRLQYVSKSVNSQFDWKRVEYVFMKLN